MFTCCFTGHRKINHTQRLDMVLKEILEDLIERKVFDFYAGGAIGWDTLCAQKVLELRQKQYPFIRLHLVLPCPAEEQTAKWTAAQKNAYYGIMKNADSVEFVSDHFCNGCMKKRNQRLIELADCCVCYYLKQKTASGTGQTVRMAEKKGIPLINALIAEQNCEILAKALHDVCGDKINQKPLE